MVVPKLRVFVSSVVDGFQDLRAAARRGIERAGAEPILVNEDLPATFSSSRNACLDLVQSSDLYLMIVGARGGWTAPSGKLVVEEELEHARKRKIPQLVFLQSVPRDADADRLASAVSNYTDGVFRKTFSTSTELEGLVESAVRTALSPMALPTTSPSIVQTRLTTSERNTGYPSLRFVLAPERREEVITPMAIESSDFSRRALEIGHAGGEPLLSYSHGKEAAVKGGALVIEQRGDQRRGHGDSVTLRVDESGVIDIAKGLGSERRDQFINGLELQADDITQALRACFDFSGRFYRHIDPHVRHSRFLWGAAILDLGYRLITRDTSPKQSYGMATSRPSGPILAFDEPRLAERRELDDAGEAIARAVTMFERKARPS